MDEKLGVKFIRLLPQEYNLTDGHAYRDWSDAELSIIENSGEIFKSLNRQMQPRIEAEYISQLLGMTGQTYDPSSVRYLICMTGSESLDIVANYLRLKRMSLTLIEPCYVGLADTFRRHEIDVKPFPDELLRAEDIDQRLGELPTGSAICLVSPNNPTGRTLTAENMSKLLSLCSRKRILLIIDAAFRAYLPMSDIYDQYQLLIESDVAFVVIEDTGKTWPTMELKGPIMAISPAIYSDILHIYADLILHVSPFTIGLLTEFLKLSERDQLAAVHGVVAQNRAAMQGAIDGTELQAKEEAFASVSWLNTGSRSGAELVQDLEVAGVYILEGTRFYWSDPTRGTNFVRVSLVRSPPVFAEACRRIRTVLKSRNY